MQQDKAMTIGEGIIGAAAGAVISWLAASVTKVGKTDFKDLVARVTRLEQDHITREEFERHMLRLGEFMKDFRNEIKADIREIKAKT
jgi:hypothetical protein